MAREVISGEEAFQDLTDKNMDENADKDVSSATTSSTEPNQLSQHIWDSLTATKATNT